MSAESFLIVRLGALGDIVHAIPVVAALREAYPAARIGWLAHPRFAPLLASGRGPRPRACRSIGGPGPQAIRDVRRERYDVCLDLQGLLKSAALAQVQRGEARHRLLARPAPRVGGRVGVLARPEATGQGTSSTRTCRCSRCSASRRAPGASRCAIPDTPVVPCTRQILGIGRSEPFALVNPGAAWPNKRWPAERFGAARAPCSRASRTAQCRAVGARRGHAGRRRRARVRRRGAHGPADDDGGDAGAVAGGARDGVGRHRAPAPGRGGRHAGRRAVRADATRPERSLGSRATWSSRATTRVRCVFKRQCTADDLVPRALTVDAVTDAVVARLEAA